MNNYPPPKVLGKLQSIAELTGDSSKLDLYRAWKSGFYHYKFRYHVVLTPDYPLTSHDDAERAAQLLFRRIQRIYYGSLLDRKKRTPMPYLTVIEQSDETCRGGKQKLHFHILLGDPIDSRIDFSDPLNRFKFGKTPNVLLTTMPKVRFGKLKNKSFKFDLFVKNGEIDYKDGIIDYVLKQTLTSNLFIAVKGSNLDWGHLHRHYTDIPAVPALS